MDLSGNTGDQVGGSFTVDATGPPVNLAASPERTNDTTPSFSFTTGAADFDEFQCRVDAAAFPRTCTSPFTPPAPLTEGEHDFVVRAFDDLGNDGGEVFRDIEIDTTGPAAEITDRRPRDDLRQHPDDLLHVLRRGRRSRWVRVRDRRGGVLRLHQPPHHGAAGDGAHTFKVRAVDDVGNRGAVDEASFTVDTPVPPDTEVDDPSVELAAEVHRPGQGVQARRHRRRRRERDRNGHRRGRRQVEEGRGEADRARPRDRADFGRR